MKILYVTPFWTSLNDVILNNNENTGMPAFILPLKKLLEMGNLVEFVFITDDSIEENIKMSKSELITGNNTVDYVRYIKGRRFKKIIQYFRLSASLRNKVRKLLLEGQYDFVYGHSEYAVAAIKEANRQNVPCGIRMYGTFVYRDFEAKGYLRVIASRPLEIMTYNTRASFKLMTNDGTDGEKAYKKFAICHRSNFLFWLNGIESMEKSSVDDVKKVTDRYFIVENSILYLARITKWKRQDQALLVLKNLHECGKKMHLYFAGQVSNSDEDYYNEVLGMIREYNLDDYVHFIGTVERTDIDALATCCRYSLLMYAGSCLGNVFHELFSAEALLICLDEHDSLSEFIDNGLNGFAVHTIEEVVSRICFLDEQPELRQSMRISAGEKSRKIMKSWDERVTDEIQLIYDSVQDYKTD